MLSWNHSEHTKERQALYSQPWNPNLNFATYYPCDLGRISLALCHNLPLVWNETFQRYLLHRAVLRLCELPDWTVSMSVFGIKQGACFLRLSSPASLNWLETQTPRLHICYSCTVLSIVITTSVFDSSFSSLFLLFLRVACLGLPTPIKKQHPKYVLEGMIYPLFCTR